MRMIRRLSTLILLLSILLPAAASAMPLAFIASPGVIRPGKFYEITVESQSAGTATVSLLDENGNPLYNIYSDYPITVGENKMQWDGRKIGEGIVEMGDYQLRVAMADSVSIDAPVRIGAPYPIISEIQQSDSTMHDGTLRIAYTLSEPGTLSITLQATDSDTPATLLTQHKSAGPDSFIWDGEVDGRHVLGGDYALILTLTAENGMQSMPEYVYISVQSEAVPEGFIFEEPEATPEPAPEPTPEPTPEPPRFSVPYSSVNDGSFWSMTPGELDDATIWNIMMQPITVYDNGSIKGAEHAYLMENPDGTGAQIAQIHGLAQGIHVLSEPNEHGYVFAELFSNYDRKYYPKTDEEKAHAFDLKQGYVKADELKRVDVKTDMALLIDKLTQRMYLFKDGVRVTEFAISTGTFRGDDYLFETPPGEFITISHTGQLRDGNMISDMAIRINGGILIHEVPHMENADGSYDYSAFEGHLGTKQSHGCIRVQRKKTPEGYNQRWLWDNLKIGAPYKVIIWDDANRVDTPGTWYENPK